MKPLKIAMVNTMYAPRVYGGAEKIVQLVAEGLTQAGHDVAVIAASPGRGIQTRTLNGVRVYDVGLINLYWPYGKGDAPLPLEAAWHAIDLWNPWMASRAGRVLRGEAPDVVHTHGFVGFSTRVWREARRLEVPIVHTLQDHRLLCVHACMYKRGQVCEVRCAICRVTSLLKRGQASNVDHVIGLSRSVLDSHLEAGFFAGTDSEVIPGPVEIPDLPVDRRAKEVLRLGYLGRIHPGKGLELVLEATLDLPSVGWELVIGGDGEERFVDHVKRLPRHQNVKFLGRVEASRFLRDVDALIVPSQLHEAAGLVVAEAFSYGIPVLGSRRGGVPEAVREGRSGFLFDPDGTAELRELLLRLVDRPGILAQFREACLEEAKRYRVERVVEAHVQCYKRAVDRKKQERRT